MIIFTGVAHAVHCQLVEGAADLAAHHAIRHAVFVGEKAVFAASNRDHRDECASTMHVIGFVDGRPAGTVRLFPLDPDDPAGDWQGDRLAVLPEYRASGLGAPLVRFAVAAARAGGGHTMIAHILPGNLTFFRRLGWVQRGGPEMYVGHPHLFMTIGLRPQG